MLNGLGEKTEKEKFCEDRIKRIKHQNFEGTRLNIPNIVINSPNSSSAAILPESINTYIGEFVDGLKDGYGREETDEYIYTGSFKKGNKHGKGKLRYKNPKDEYEGNFMSGLISGEGYYSWANGCSYKGSYSIGKMHGSGVYKWPDGTTYIGEYHNNIKHGQGRLEKSDGKTFEGSFVEGKLSDFSKSKTTDGEVELRNSKSNKYLSLGFKAKHNTRPIISPQSRSQKGAKITNLTIFTNGTNTQSKSYSTKSDGKND